MEREGGKVLGVWKRDWNLVTRAAMAGMEVGMGGWWLVLVSIAGRTQRWKRAEVALVWIMRLIWVAEMGCGPVSASAWSSTGWPRWVNFITREV